MRRARDSEPWRQTLWGKTLGAAVIPLPGRAQAVYLSTGLAYYRHSDWLGSARLTSTSTPAVFASGALAPYGEVYDWTGTSAYESFTGEQQGHHQRRVYDFPARRLSASMGRWISPDPLGVGAVDPTNPQSWNRYAYVLNNPLSNIDPSGLDKPWDDGSYDAADDPDTGSAESCAAGGGRGFPPDIFEGAMGTNPGDWSANPDPATAWNWLTPSATVYGGPNSASTVSSWWPNFTVNFLGLG